MSGVGPLRQPSDFIGGRWAAIPGDDVVSRDPAAPDHVVWSGSPRMAHVDEAVAAAREAFPAWRSRSMDERASLLRRFAEVCGRHAERLARTITAEMGKTLAESRAEAKLLQDKVSITLDPLTLSRVRDFEVDAGAGKVGRCQFRPLGVMAVVGPFNFPAHLPHGHWVPALLLGNTVVFKPSDRTPATGQLVAEIAEETGFPAGVFNVVQGGAEIASSLVCHPDIDGVLFTGSFPVGRRILEANLDRPGRMIALEMGGSNAAIVWHDADPRRAVLECLRSAYATTGQRCTCTRRVLVHEAMAERFITAFCKVASTAVIGAGTDPEPVFMGPVVSRQARDAVLERQVALAGLGGRVLMEAVALDRPGWFVGPGLVQVPRFDRGSDCETFGPLVQVSVVSDLDDAIAQANATDFGLVAAVFTRSDAVWRSCQDRIRVGCLNRNTGTAGASSRLPFGGLGRSGNLRPAGSFAVDLAAYPLASMEDGGEATVVPPGVRSMDDLPG
ncbi:MAG: aldehyde dehydrogenase family protein [Planctomycetes bacterium]|nr:aldehyde dehydrogenase family protein [Planctomycetota bacterium]